MGLVTPTPPVPPRQPFLRRSALFFLFLFLSLAHAVSSQAADDAPAAGSLQAAPNAPAPFGAPQRIDHVPASIRDYRFNAPSALSPAHTDEPEETVTRGYGDPTIEELKLSPIALVVTVDGHVHALKRETGQWMWTLHDDGGVALGGTVTEEGKAKRKGAGAAVGGPLVSGMGRRRASTAAAGSFGSSAGRAASSSANETGLLEQEEEEEEVYVIEPHSQGDIYVYTRDGAGGSLEKLPLSMQELVALSPFTFPSDASRMFVGRKESKLVGVDLRTGRLVGVFGSGSGWCEWDEAREGRVKTEEECDEEISRRPEDLLYMARTEYHISIYSKSSSSLLQTLAYTTYSSSSLGTSLQSQWTRTPDSRYLQAMHDGSLMCFLSGASGLQWTIAFEVPVVSIFDIAIPPSGIDGSGGESAQPLMFEQPHPLPIDGLPIALDQLSALPETTFIGKLGGDLFAMSRDNFPLVAFAPLNTLDQPADGTTGEPTSNCEGTDCLLGRHFVLSPILPPPEPPIERIDPPLDRLGIEAPPLRSTLPSSPTPSSPRGSSPHAPDRSSVLAALYKPVSKLSSGYSSAVGVLLLAVVGYLYARKLWTVKLAQIVERKVNEMGTTAKRGLEEAVGQEDVKVLRVETSPLVPALPLAQLADSLPIVITTTPLVRKVESPTSIPLRLGSPASVLKELPPIPAVSDTEVNDDGDGDSDGEAKDGADGTPKKKGRRRRGKKTKKVRLEEVTGIELFPTDELMDKDLKNITLGDVDVKEEGSEEDGFVVVAAVDPQLIGSLLVSETILGYGSHGTVVLRGEFQGRAVAVKRLLKDFVTIATHEVALLQESDDHPHVIRYFCKEQRDTFLYIALELCPASLYELIDQPLAFPDLARDLDPKRALRQITSGIRHLHKLKIVHRDIKPQNILVSTSKHGGVRMLISDFGLCKKLDMDESSFQQTVNHAAGSFGYRAPEVLRGQVDPNAGISSPMGSTIGSKSGSGSTGSGINMDPAMRLTRSIDIFSLGCIFYYVLTGGEHPFGGRYEREMNILKGKLSLERLDGLGEEALEVQDLITRMVATDPRERPSAEAVILHPFFWNAQKRLLFICDASDRFEIMERDPPTATLVTLEESARIIVGDDWSKGIDRTLLDNLGKYRKYDGKSVRDLLRVLRNKKHHYQDLPEAVRTHLGDLPNGFLTYFTSRFPRLLLHVYETVSIHLADETMFLSTFQIQDEEQ